MSNRRTRLLMVALLTGTAPLAFAQTYGNGNQAQSGSGSNQGNAGSSYQSPSTLNGKSEVSGTTRMRAMDNLTSTSTYGNMHTGGMAAGFPGKLVKADKLIGIEVQNAQKETLGEINDVVLDTQRDRVDYAVLSFGGIMGLGDKLFAVPIQSLRQGPNGDVLVLNRTKQELKNAPGFNQDRWPDMNSATWRSGVDKFYGVDATGSNTLLERANQGDQASRDSMTRTNREQSENGTMSTSDRENRTDREPSEAVQERFESRKLSEVLGMDVKDRGDETIGNIKNAVIDMSTGRVAYAVVAMEGHDMDDQYVDVPWGSLYINPQSKTAGLSGDLNNLKQFAYKAGQEPDLQDRAYASRLHQQFSQNPYWQTYGYRGTGSNNDQRSDRTDRTDRAGNGNTDSSDSSNSTLGSFGKQGTRLSDGANPRTSNGASGSLNSSDNDATNYSQQSTRYRNNGTNEGYNTGTTHESGTANRNGSTGSGTSTSSTTTTGTTSSY